MTCGAEPGSKAPSSTPIPGAQTSGPPMSPSMAVPCGTRPDRYFRQPR